jgi:hypothetical protein
MSTINVNRIVDSSGGVLSPISSIMRNRLINGNMVIDQRNAGASVTPASGDYTLDRFFASLTQTSKFSVQQNAGSVTPPVGFTNYLGVTSLSAYSITSTDFFMISQLIEGFNTADLGFGTANAKTVTLSFQVYSSLTGTFGGALQNSAGDRSYPFTYSIPTANTWTTIAVTIAGDTTGTWVGATNGIGIKLRFGLGIGSTNSATAGSWQAGNFFSATGATSVVGTSGATFYITGVQLEVGTQATSFEYRQYTTELQLCQRYYAKTFLQETAPAQNASNANAINVRAATTGQPISAQWKLPVTMRAAPTLTTFNPFAANANWSANPNSPVVASFLGTEVISIFGTTNTFNGNGYFIHATAEIEL